MKFAINLLLLLITLSANAETILRFHNHITPAAKRVEDLLIITPDKKHWGKIKLEHKPTAGTHISKKQVIAWLQQKTGLFTYQWRGKHKAMIQPMTRSSSKELIEKAQLTLAKELNKYYSEIELRSITVPKDSDIALANLKIQIPALSPATKRICVHLNYQKRSIPIWFAVKAYQSVLVAKHRIKPYTLLKHHEVIIQKRNITDLQKPLTHFPNTVWLIHSINKNQVLTEADLKPQPEIMPGKKVQVQVQQNGIAIDMEAVAVTHGYRGQVIQIKNPRTNKIFEATVTNKNKAEIIV